jgi:histidine triad (HIT) family protein
MNKEDCIFCKIVAGTIPCHKVYEDEYTLAFLDIAPVNIGHTLVIPKIHAPNIYEMDQENWSHVMETVRKITPNVKAAAGAEGINIIMNNDASAGQVVFHSHVHIVPRYTGDGHAHWHGARGYNPGEAEEVANKIK